MTPCERCDGEGYIEIMGDTENSEWEPIGFKDCPDCKEYD